jgi:hypothetical protein
MRALRHHAEVWLQVVPRDELDRGGHLELIGIRLDGSEVVVRGLPNRIAFGDVPTINSLEMTLTASLERAEKPRELPSPQYDRIVIAIAIVLLLGGVVFARLWLRNELQRAR